MRRAGSRNALGIAAALLAAAALIGGCGGGDESESADGLEGALAEASTTGEGPLYVTWIDVAALREAGDLPADLEAAFDGGRWATPVAIAVGDALTGLVGSDLGFDPMGADATISAGIARDAATRYDGVDAEAVEAAFEEMGFEPEGEFLALGGEGELVDRVAGDAASGLLGINRVRADGDSVAMGAYEEPVSAILTDESPVIDEPGAPAAAGCLGADAFAATLLDPEGGTAAEVALVAVGLRAPGEEGTVPEVVCAVGTEGESVEETAECMRGSFGPGGINPVTGRPFSFDLGEGTVETGETDGVPWARATFEPTTEAPVGTVFEMLSDGSLELALGGIDPSSLLRDRVTPEQAEEIADQFGDCGA